jgi:4-amino-4-deoxy-L-arabinose transferase-like glycosyltransferase
LTATEKITLNWKPRQKMAISVEALMVLLILLLAFVLRWGYVSHLPNTYLNSDEGWFDVMARNLVAGKGLSDFAGRPTAFRLPFPSIFFAAVYFVTEPELLNARMAQAVLGSITIVIVYLIARRLFSREVALLSAVLCALNPLLIAWTGLLMRETFMTFTIALLVLLLLTMKEQTHIAVRFLAGLIWGVLVLTNPIGVFLVPFLLVYLWIKHSPRPFIRFCAPIVAGLLLLWSGWVVRNYVAYGQLIPFSTWDGAVLYQKSHPEVQDRNIIKLPQETRSMSEANRNAYLLSKSVAAILENPEYYLRLVRHRMFDFWYHGSLEAYIENTQLWFLGRPWATIWQWNATFLDLRLVPLTILGLLFSLRFWRRASILYLLLASFTLFYGLLSVYMNKHRIPMIPYEMVFAAVGIVSVPTLAYRSWTFVRSERGRRYLHNGIAFARRRVWLAAVSVAAIGTILSVTVLWGNHLQGIFDDTPPALSLNVRENGHDLGSGKKVLLVNGMVEAGTHLTITHNGERAEVVTDGSVFRKKILLAQGKNDIIIEASDKVGNKTKREYTFWGDDLSLGEYAYFLTPEAKDRAIPLRKVALTNNADLPPDKKANPPFRVSYPEGEPEKFMPQPQSSGTIYEELTDGLTTGSGYYTWESVRWKGAVLHGGYGHMVRSILFTFEKEQYITDVIIKSPTPYPAYRVSQVDLSVSKDGQKFQKVGSDAISNSYWVQGLDTLAIEGIEKSARYVKIDVHKLGTDMLVSEVFILGLVDEDGRSPSSFRKGGVISKLISTRQRVPIRDESNLKKVPNGGFEIDQDHNNLPDNWGGAQWSGTVDYSLDTSTSTEGHNSVRLETHSTKVNFALISQPIPVSPNKRYYLSGMMRNPSNSTPSNIEVQFLDHNKSQVALATAKATATTKGWTKLELQGTVPQKAAYAVLRLRIFNSQKAGEKIWFDDIRLYGDWD